MRSNETKPKKSQRKRIRTQPCRKSHRLNWYPAEAVGLSSPTSGSVMHAKSTQTECFTHTCSKRVRLPPPPRGGSRSSSRFCTARAASDPLCTLWLSQILRGRPTLSDSTQSGAHPLRILFAKRGHSILSPLECLRPSHGPNLR